MSQFTKIQESHGDKKAVVYLTLNAWAKMVFLINEFDSEVAWHGVAHRMREVSGEAATDGVVSEYIITDIVIYPQTVSSVFVDMDTEKYAKWLVENDDDVRFKHLFMQGHSHVKMPTTPSSVDLKHQEEILEMMGDGDFYIFMIWNKWLSCNVRIYDMECNTLYENCDVAVKIFGGEAYEEFIKNAKDVVVDKGEVAIQKDKRPRVWVGRSLGVADEDDALEH